ncbi:MAG: hypothetical protein ACK55Z_21915, partial [bacterium]
VHTHCICLECPPPPPTLVPMAATMNCDTETGTDSRDGSTSVHSTHSSDISSQSSEYHPQSSDDNR